jgi:hypothetical protein
MRVFDKPPAGTGSVRGISSASTVPRSFLHIALRRGTIVSEGKLACREARRLGFAT